MSELIWPPEPPFCDLGDDFTTPFWEERQCSGDKAPQSTNGLSCTSAVPGDASLEDRASTTCGPTSTAGLDAASHGVTEASMDPMPPLDTTHQPQSAHDVPHGAKAPDLQGLSAQPQSSQSSAAQHGAYEFDPSNQNFVNSSFTGQQWTPHMQPSSDFQFTTSASVPQHYLTGAIGKSDARTQGPYLSPPNHSQEGSESVNGYWTATSSQPTSKGAPPASHPYFTAGHIYNRRTQNQSHPRTVPYTSPYQAYTSGSQYGEESRAGAARTMRSSNFMRSAATPRDPGFRVEETSASRKPPYCNSLEDPMSSDNGSIPEDLQDIDLYEGFKTSPPPPADWFAGIPSNGQTGVPGTTVQGVHPPSCPLLAEPEPRSTVPHTLHRPVNGQLHGTMMSMLEQNGRCSISAQPTEHTGNSFVTPGAQDASSLAQSAGRTSALIVPLSYPEDGASRPQGNTTDPSLPQNACHSFAPTGGGRKSTPIQNNYCFHPPGFQDPTQQGIRPPLIVCIVRQNDAGIANSNAQQQLSTPTIPQTTQSVSTARSVGRDSIPSASLETQVQSLIETALTSQNATLLPDLDSNDGRSSAIEALRSLLLHKSPFTVSDSQAQTPNSDDTQAMHASNVPRTDLGPREAASSQNCQYSCPPQSQPTPQIFECSEGSGPASETPTLSAMLSASSGDASQKSSSVSQAHALAQDSPPSSVTSMSPPAFWQNDPSTSVPQTATRARS